MLQSLCMSLDPMATNAEQVGQVSSWVNAAAGFAALLGGLVWLVKGIAIPAVDEQPRMLFEVAPVFYGAALLGLGLTLPQRGRRRSAVIALASISLLASIVGVATELAGSVLGVSLLIAALCLFVVLIALGRRARSRAHRLGSIIGMSMIPALAVGGVLSAWDERLLEVPLVGLAVLWIWLGWTLARSAPAAPT